MYRRRITLVLGLALLLCTLGRAQNVEVGIFMGISNYMGDFQPNQIEPNENHLAFGLYGRYYITPYLSGRLGIYKAKISGNDRHSDLLSGRKARNLHFESSIEEIHILAECHFLSFMMRERPMVSPYIYTGFAGFHFNPKAEIDNKMYELQPLGTEGQGLAGRPDRYSLYQFSVPMGMGVEILVGNAVKIGLELGARKTFTDYLDDVSGVYADINELAEVNPLSAELSFRRPEFDPSVGDMNPVGGIRGNPDKKDWYVMGGINFSVNIAALTGLGGGPGVYCPF